MKLKNLFNTYVVGDVHGCFYTLKKLLAQLPSDANVIFVGDLCDRGLYTKEVIELLIKKGYYAIRGNHDDYMITHLQECLDNTDLCVRWNSKDFIGGQQTLQSYENDYEIMLKHIKWMATMPRYIEIEHYFITHGFGLPYYERRDKALSHTALLKNRISDEAKWGHEWEDGWQEYKVINIYGHTHNDEVFIGKNYYGIDTACVYGGKLTAIELGSMKLYQQPLDPRDIAKSD